MTFRGLVCSYCGERPATGVDHVIPRVLRKKYVCRWMQATGVCPCRVKHRRVPDELLLTVPCCLECNVRKSTRLLVPPSWAGKVVEIRELFPGDWRTWHGSVREPAFKDIHWKWAQS